MRIVNFCKHIVKLLIGREQIKLSLVRNEIKFDIYKEYVLDESLLHDYKQIIAVDGPGCSGSSAVTDYLAEFCSTTTFGGVDVYENPQRGIEQGFECNFLREPHSILDLERICYTKVGGIRDNAVREFIDHVTWLYNYGPKILYRNENFLYFSRQFLLKFIYFPYANKNFAVKYDLTVEEYRKYAAEYLHNILRSLPCDDILVLDNISSISEPNLTILNSYLPGLKVFYVLRDPRDIYTHIRECNYEDLSWIPFDKDKFCAKFRLVLPQFVAAQNNQIKCIRFEDLCHDYDRTAAEINAFAGLDEADHVNKRKYFNPDDSIKNTGIHKKYADQESIKYIYDNLREYCYEN